MVAEKPTRTHAPATTPRLRESRRSAPASPGPNRQTKRMAVALFLSTFLTTLVVLYLTEHAGVQSNQLKLTRLERDVHASEQQVKDLEREISTLQLSVPVGDFVHAHNMVRTGTDLNVVEIGSTP
jgi:cell division protein FtsL